MKHKIVIELEFESDFIGFEDWPEMTEIDLIKFLIREEGLFGIIDTSNEEFAECVKSIEKVREG